MTVDQNLDALTSIGIKLQEIQEAFTLPALLKEKWVKRVDSSLMFKRRVRRIYNIRNLLVGTVTVTNNT